MNHPDGQNPGERRPDDPMKESESARIEPLHQPPNPAELNEVPPASPECARARSLMRDFADHDLTPEDVRLVEGHVHDCRTCALSLARSEYEVFRVRSGFLAGWAAVSPRPGFARRTVERLLAETATDRRLPPIESPAARAVTNASVVPVAPVSAKNRRPRVQQQPIALAVAACCFIVVLVVATSLWTGGAALSTAARLTIVAANGAFLDAAGARQRLGAKDGLGDGSTLVVEADGSVIAEFHDSSLVGKQPGAGIDVEGSSVLRLNDGLPELVRGAMTFTSERSMQVRAGGDLIELGAGKYRIRATEDASVLDVLDAARSPAAIQVEVLSGDSARLVAAGGKTLLVGAGQVGRMGEGGVGFSLENLPPRNGGGLAARTRPDDENPTEPPAIAGVVLDNFGAPLSGASVSLSYLGDGLQQFTAQLTTDGTGSFSLPPRTLIASGEVAIEVWPPHAGLGPAVRDLYPIAEANGVRSVPSIQLRSAVRVVGQIVSSTGAPISGAQVIPCIYDELFGLLQPWQQADDWTNGAGEFELSGMPTRLPSHQAFGVLVSAPGQDVAFRALPLPGSAASQAERVELSPLSTFTIEGFPRTGTCTIYQELKGLPTKGLGMRQYDVDVVAGGSLQLAVGGGNLWLGVEDDGATTLRRIELHNGRLRVDDESVPFDRVFAAMSDTVSMATQSRRRILIANSNRLDNLTRTAGVAATTYTASRDGDTQVASLPLDTQAYVLQGSSCGGYRVRSQGRQHQQGFALDFGNADSEVVAVLGSWVGRMSTVDLSQGGQRRLMLQAPGAIAFAPSSLPQNGILRLTLTPRQSGPAGSRPKLYRYVSRDLATATDIPPGDYDLSTSSSWEGVPVTVHSGEITNVP